MKTITFHCQFITPAFIGNAIPGEAELRPPAIKGALRFWWRAMNGHLEIDELREKEAEIFGSADKNFGRSKMLVILSTTELPIQEPFGDPAFLERKIRKGDPRGRPPINAHVNVLEYLAFGPIYQESGEKIISEYYDAGTKFTLKISYQEPVQREIIEEAIFICGVFGGFGSRSRNGFGRFLVEELKHFKELEVIKKWMQSNGSEKGMTSYHSFSKQTKLFKGIETGGNWQNCLGELGRNYITGRVRYTDHTGSVVSDGIEDERSFDKRPFIAMPLQEKKPVVNGVPLNLERHAKSHFMGLCKTEEGIQGYILHLPYYYLKNYKDQNGHPLANLSGAQNKYETYQSEFNNSLINQGMNQIL